MWNFKDSHLVTEEPFQVLAVWVESCIFSGQPVSRCLLYDQIKQPIEYDHYIICFDNTFHANDLKIAKKLFETVLNELQMYIS